MRGLSQSRKGQLRLLKNRKWLRALVGLIILALAYRAYTGWRSYQYQQGQRAEQLELGRQQARQKELDRQNRELFERFKTQLESLHVLRAGSLHVQFYTKDAKSPFQTLDMPFVLELGQSVVFPPIQHKERPAHLKVIFDARKDDIKPTVLVRDANKENAGWELASEGNARFDRMQIKLSLRPSAHAWAEPVVLSAPKNVPSDRGEIKLFLLKPSRARATLSADEQGRFVVAPDESGLWRYLWYVENKTAPTRSVEIGKGVFFVGLPTGRKQLENAAKRYYRRLSKDRDESSDYQEDQLVRALAAYGRKGAEESAFVDAQLELIRSKEPGASKKTPLPGPRNSEPSSAIGKQPGT